MADAAELPPVTQQLRFLASGPPMMGWVFNIFLAGVCASTAARQLFNNEYHTRGTKQCVAVVMILYTCNTIITWYEIFYWSTLQNPDYNDLYTFIIPDAIVTIPGGLLAAVVQSLFVFRAYKVAKYLLVYEPGLMEAPDHWRKQGLSGIHVLPHLRRADRRIECRKRRTYVAPP